MLTCAPSGQALVKHPDLVGVPILIMANKQDMRGALGPSDLEAIFAFRTLCSTRQPYHVAAVSAIKGDGIADGIDWMVETLKRGARSVG